MDRQATAQELLQILSRHSAELQNALGIIDVKEIQFSLPTDGAGLRIKAAVLDVTKVNLPSQINFCLQGKKIVVPIELSEDFQDYKLQSSHC